MFEVVAPANPDHDLYRKPIEVLQNRKKRMQEKKTNLETGHARGTQRRRGPVTVDGASPTTAGPRLRRRKSIVNIKSTRTIGLQDMPHMKYPGPVVDCLKEMWANFGRLESVESVGSIDILMWACTMCDPDMVQIFWRRTTNPLETALVASLLCKELTQKPEAEEGAWCAKLGAISHAMENCAKEVMEKCTTSGDAAMILRRKSALFNAYVAEIAVLNNEAEIKEASDPDASSWSLEQEEEEESESDAAFLAHPYCGATLEDIWCGDYLRTGQDGMYENLLILCQVCYPLRQVLPSRLLRPNTAWKYLHFVRVPRVKFVAHNFAYACFLATYLLVLSGSSNLMWLVFGFWIFGLTMDELLDFLETDGLSHFSSFVNVLDAGCFLVMHVVLAIRLAVTTGMYSSSAIYIAGLGSIVTWKPKLFKCVTIVALAEVLLVSTGISGWMSALGSIPSLESVGLGWTGLESFSLSSMNCLDKATKSSLQMGSMKILSINVVLVFFRLFSVMTASGPVGAMVITIVKMVNARFQSFAILSFFITVSFAAAFAGIALANRTETAEMAGGESFASTVVENLVALSWAFLGSDVEPETNEDGSPREDIARASLVWVYLLLAQLLLANGVLIALLTDTYESVRDRAYGESVMNRLSMLHEFMCKHWLPPPLTAVFIMLNFLGGDGESDDSLSEDAGVARRMFGWAGRMVETVTSRETQMHMASDADNDLDEKASNIETQAMRRWMRGRSAVTQPTGEEEEEEDPVEAALGDIKERVDELQRTMNRKLHDLTKKFADQFDDEQTKLKRAGSKRLLQRSASKIKMANRLLSVRASGGGASAPTGLAQGGRRASIMIKN